MARRKQKQLIDPATSLNLLITAGVIWFIARNLQRISFIILIVGAVALTYAIVRHRRRVDVRRILLQNTQAIIEQQISALVRRRAQLVWKDAYGKPQEVKWLKEKDQFITQHLNLHLLRMNAELLSGNE
jgi:hypothetical protein